MRVDFKGIRETMLIKNKKELGATCLPWMVCKRFQLQNPNASSHSA